MPQQKLLLGLIGAGIQRSLTPGMHEAEGRQQGLALHYQLIDLDRAGASAADLGLLIQAARIMGFAGLNITYPCKQAVLPLLDDLSDGARRMGAVNTVVFRDGRAIGHNTDGSGWTWAFQRAVGRPDLRRVVLLGAGGAGSAIAHELLTLGADRLSIVDIDGDRARALADELNRQYAGMRAMARADIAAAMADATGLVHATPTGMEKLPGLPLPAQLLRPAMWVSEVVYFPIETALLAQARAIGCPTVDGGGMAVGQAVDAFRLFTGRQPDAERMRQCFVRLLAERESAARGDSKGH